MFHKVFSMGCLLMTTCFKMIELFFSPILEHFCPFLVKIAQMGLILPRWGDIGDLFCPNPHPQPLSLTLQSHTPFGDMYVHRTPKSPPQNTPFPSLNLKVGKMNYHLGNLDPNWAKCLKRGQNFSRSGPKENIIRNQMQNTLAKPNKSHMRCQKSH